MIVAAWVSGSEKGSFPQYLNQTTCSTWTSAGVSSGIKRILAPLGASRYRFPQPASVPIIGTSINRVVEPRAPATTFPRRIFLIFAARTSSSSLLARATHSRGLSSEALDSRVSAGTSASWFRGAGVRSSASRAIRSTVGFIVRRYSRNNAVPSWYARFNAGSDARNNQQTDHAAVDQLPGARSPLLPDRRTPPSH